MKGIFKVRDIRLFLGLTQKEMAEALGISTNTYINKEKKNKFYFSEIKELSESFGISLEAIDAEEEK